MTKRVFRYFFDYIDGQQKWLNEMAKNGWRLEKCGQLAYDFESCTPGEYEYAVDFVGDKSYSKSRDYKAFLESMGYKTFYKNINIGVFIGKVKWRPWGEGAGQITTAPGSLQKELVIVEKQKDGKAFELHTDLTDLLNVHKKIRAAYAWTAGGMLALAAMLGICAIWMKSIYMGLGAAACAALGVLWLIPARKVSKTIRKLDEAVETNEYEAPDGRKKAFKIATLVAVPVLIVAIVAGTLHFSGASPDRYLARSMVQTSLGSRWSARYGYLDGYKQRNVSLDAGTHTFSIEITTTSGEISLSIMSGDGTEYYKGTCLPTSNFQVQVDLPTKDKLTLRVDANDHKGSYQIAWD